MLKMNYKLSYEGNDICGSFDFVNDVVYNLSWPFRYSESEDKFIKVEDMHTNHLINSLKLEFDLVDSIQDLNHVLNDVLMNEINKRNVD